MRPIEFDRQLAELQPSLHRLTKRFVKSREDSSDLVQETLLKALRYRARFKENRNLAGWLYIIMRNTFINKYRKHALTRASFSSDLPFSKVEGASSQRADDSVHIDELWKVINSVDEELSKPFKMYLSGYRYEEIAEHLHVPLGTVKSRIFLARQEIRSQLHEYRK